jgi:sec-independent protein translocase protein TatC
LVFSFVLDYLLEFNRWLGIDPDPRINEWLGTALLLPVGFGVSFQLPLVMLFLERIGIMSVKTYLEKWRIVVLVIFIVSAVLTPADPYSMLFMALPLCLLFFVGIGLCHWWPKQKRTHEIIPA